MMEHWWVGAALGTGLGVAYGVSSLLINRWALRLEGPKKFVIASIGGVAVRMLAALGLVAFVLLLTAVHAAAFVGAFFIVFVLGLALEIAILHRTANANGSHS